MTQMKKTCKITKTRKLKLLGTVTFESIQTRLAPQNDRLNLSFVKYIYANGGKLARNGRTTAICQSQILVNSLYVY